MAYEPARPTLCRAPPPNGSSSLNAGGSPTTLAPTPDEASTATPTSSKCPARPPQHGAHHAEVELMAELTDLIAGVPVSETYDNGVRHVSIRDPDGNLLAYAEAP